MTQCAGRSCLPETREVLERMGESALKSLKEGKTISLDEFLELTDDELLNRFPSDEA